LRYRVNQRPLPELRRTSDIVFRKARVAVFVDGCFWHGCPDHYKQPSTNARYWSDKVEGNRRRDLETDACLAEAGWTVLRHWEHEARVRCDHRLPTRSESPIFMRILGPVPR
jgi:DNA mismatch endonuclease (patch repair protein)